MQDEKPELARQALNRFHDAYLPEYKKKIPANTAADNPRLFKLEDGWLAYKLIGKYIAIVFECPDLESARTILQKNESNLLEKRRRIMKDKRPVLTRRDFIRGTIGVTLGASVFGLLWPQGEARQRSSLVTVVRDKNAMDSSKNIDIAVLEKMLAETLTKVTGQKNTKDAWLSLVKPNDVIGLVPTDHLNPTHDEVVEVVKNSLVDVGIPEDRIRDAQGPRNAKKCDALIAIPGLKSTLVDRDRHGSKKLHHVFRQPQQLSSKQQRQVRGNLEPSVCQRQDKTGSGGFALSAL